MADDDAKSGFFFWFHLCLYFHSFIVDGDDKETGHIEIEYNEMMEEKWKNLEMPMMMMKNVNGKSTTIGIVVADAAVVVVLFNSWSVLLTDRPATAGVITKKKNVIDDWLSFFFRFSPQQK